MPVGRNNKRDDEEMGLVIKQFRSKFRLTEQPQEEFNERTWIEKYCYIEDKETGILVPFKLNEAQIILWNAICEMKSLGLPVRINILKGRQKGISTFIAAYMFAKAWHYPDRLTYIMAHVIDTVEELYLKPKKMYEKMPDEMKAIRPLSAGKPKKSELEFDTPHNSKIKIGTAKTIDIGRGTTPRGAHLSEAARFEDLLGLNSGMLTGVPTVPNTDVFKETTARGKDAFYQEWQRAKRKKKKGPLAPGDYMNVFIGLMDFPPYAIQLEPGEKLELSEAMVLHKEKHNLPDEKVKFLLMELEQKFNGKMELMIPEYPCDEDEAFSDKSYAWFDTAELDRQLELATPPIKTGRFQFTSEYRGSGVEFIEDQYGLVEIWEELVDGANYVSVLDTATGRGGDFTVCHVYKIEEVVENLVANLDQVATYHSNQEDIRSAGLQAYMMSQYYNRASIGIETTGIGDAMLSDFLKGFLDSPQTLGGYSNVFREPVAVDPNSDKDKDRPGIAMTGTSAGTGSKIRFMKKGQEFVFRQRVRFRCERTIKEVRGLVYDPKKTIRPWHQVWENPETGEKHDDEPMAFILAPQVLQGWLTRPKYLEAFKKKVY